MSNALQPVDQRTILFYDDEITAVVVDVDGREVVFVPIRPICEFLGVAWSPQRRRINRDPILSDALASVTVTVTESGQRGQVLCLPLDYLNGWLFGINADRVKADVREQVLRYQRECYRVLADAFLRRPASAETSLSPLEQVREMGLAIARMAEEQIVFEQRLGTTEQRLDKAAVIVGDNRKRITSIEKRLFSAEPVSEEQASQISEAVKLIAQTISKTSGKNEFARVYMELYREFGITSYKLLPVDDFSKAMAFLTDWFKRL